VTSEQSRLVYKHHMLVYLAKPLVKRKGPGATSQMP